MAFEYHPEAQRNLSERGEALLLKLSQSMPEGRAPDDQRNFVPDRPIAGTLTDNDITGIIKQSSSDADGREISRFAGTKDGMVFFEGDQHGELIAIAQSAFRPKEVRESVSFEAILDWIVEWALYRRLSQTTQPLAAYLSERRFEAVATFEILIPIYEPYIEIPLTVGSTTFRPLTRAELEAWFVVRGEIPALHRARVEEDLTRRRLRLQARTTAVVQLQAEERRANELAWAKADLATAMIRLISKGIFFPQSRSNCVPLGVEVSPRQQLIVFKNGELTGWSESLLDPEGVGGWTLDRVAITRSQPYWNDLGKLVDGNELSELGQDTLRALILYSRLALSSQTSEKLVHLFAALESILLRSESEPIQASVSERFAFVVGRSGEERAQIARLVKDVYGLRSRFVHHGHEPENPQHLFAVKSLLKHTWTFFFLVVRASEEYKTRIEFLDAIERRKWQ